MRNKSFIAVITGPSGAGKTSVAERLADFRSDIVSCRSATTREARPTDKKGEYLYVTRDEFSSLLTSGQMLEYTEYSGSLYGTPVSETESAFAGGKIPLLVLDLDGACALKQRKLDASVFVFYVYDDINVVEQRLYDRDLLHSPTPKALAAFVRRKEANIRDYLRLDALCDCVDFFVRNDSLERAAAELGAKLDALLSGAAVISREENLCIAKRLSQSAAEKCGAD